MTLYGRLTTKIKRLGKRPWHQSPPSERQKLHLKTLRTLGNLALQAEAQSFNFSLPHRQPFSERPACASMASLLSVQRQEWRSLQTTELPVPVATFRQL
jgi:hypothetical protein